MIFRLEKERTGRADGASRARSRCLPDRGGYTAIEVLLAMTVLAIGAAGVMSMQAAAIQGDVDARKLDMANSIARDWMERIRRDATAWTTPGSTTTNPNISGDPLLASALSQPPGTWVLPPIPASYPADGQSPAFDILGRDLAGADAAGAIFCVHVALNTVSATSPSAPIPNDPDLVRVVVRVFWLRQLNYITTGTALSCPNSLSGPLDPALYHFVYETSAVRKNPI